MKLKSIKKIEMEGIHKFSLFNFVIEINNKEETFKHVKRFGQITENDMRKLVESCQYPYEIFYIDDSKYDSISTYLDYQKRFPELKIPQLNS